VYCGIHDSNAAYLCHLAEQGNPRSRSADNPFSVVSSGTWTVVLAQGAPLRNLQEPLDMLANLDAFGHPVATARFMGGREYAQIAGPEGCQSIPDRQALSDLINNHVMALPSFSSQGGPFAGQEGSVIHAEAIATDRERATLATLYTALMTDLLLDNLGAGGNLIIDGPLATNPLFGRILQTFRSGGWVYANHTAHAAAIAARFLVSGLAPNVSREPCVPLLLEAAGLIEYRYKWRSRIAELLSQRQNPILVEQ
jgi:sugar (pentulose or hexulose) kinase